MRDLAQDNGSFEYDVCLSFAGEDRAYVRAVATRLREHGARVFFDEYEKAQLWGKDLYTHLDKIYRHAARFCVLFASAHYAGKVWTDHERQSAQARAFSENEEYILPARFDDTTIPGLRPTVGYVDLRTVEPDQLADLIVEKVGKRQRKNYFPTVPDVLFDSLGINDEGEQDEVQLSALSAFRDLLRMTADERDLVAHFVFHACYEELPENLHINVDYLRRLSGRSATEVKQMLGQLQSLGIFCSIREDDSSDQYLGEYPVVVMEWHDMREGGGNVTAIVAEMFGTVIEDCCLECGKEAVRRLDFGRLTSANAGVN